MKSAPIDAKRMPLERAKQPRKKLDERTEAEVAERAQDPDSRRQYDQLDVLVLTGSDRETLS